MISYVIRKQKITLLFFTMIVLLGFLTFFQLPRQETPDIIVNVATVVTVYPGASPEKVEQNVTKKIEEKVNEIQGLKNIRSESTLGASTIVVEVKDGIDPKTKFDELRKKVKDAEKDLPPDAKQPVINDDLNRTFIQTFNISAASIDQLYSLRNTLKTWKDQLRTIPGVSDVKLDGLPDKEVRAEIDTQKLARYGLSWGQVLNAIKAENDKVGLGNFDVGSRTYQLYLPDNYHADELNRVIVSRTPESYPIYLQDIGTVKETTKKVDYYAYQNGRPAITLSINAEVGSDVPTIQSKVDNAMTGLKKSLPTWAKVDSIYSQNERVHELFSDLTREMLIAVGAVLLVCTLGLNLTTSLVVALAIPISLALGLMFLPSLGITLNQMSIVGLIIVLGILVDDAVVVNDNIERRLQVLGEDPETAATHGAKEVSISILTATLATIAAFGPLLFLQGNAGQFIRPIPVIISLTMLASMLMSLTIIPIFRRWRESRARTAAATIPRKPAGLLGKQLASLTGWYSGRLMPRMLNKPLNVGLAGILLGTAAYGLIPLLPIELFPKADRAELLVNLRTPTGSNLQATNRVALETSQWLLKQKGVLSVASYTGGSAPKMFSGDTGAGDGIEVAQLVVTVDRKVVQTSDVVSPWTAALEPMFPGVRITPKELSAGPPVGDPVVVRVYGGDIPTLRKLSNQIKETIASLPGTRNINDDFGIERYALEFHVKKDIMDQKMVSYSDLSRTLRLAGEGLTVDQFDDSSDLIDIKLYASKNDGNALGAIQQLTVPNSRGQQIPLSELVSTIPSFTIQNIPHRSLSRDVEISSDVSGRTATDVISELKPKLSALKMPEGYRWEIGGETSEQTDIFISLGKLSIIVVFLIVILIAMQFYSLSLPILVMSTVYLAFAGSLIGLFITQTPLGFMTMMGAISLSGIVVRNGIVLIEFIEEARRDGVELKQAVIRAGEARLRPILLTTMTAVAGLTPLAVSNDVLFRPLAMTIIFGLIFSTVLTLVVVPSLYTVLAQRKMKRSQKKKQEPPAISL
ncbi:efflux RND transporter permease subunit [Aneurinibacillus sp. Ricciae_BoGa-3]|uniref:efflux RND transporter permease subunit n=1 Tax=Aneurinibacillus sp. Ricciae_BoGa-3 TaxID=3022697 RepID=UPI00233FCB0C|nr:efflux RND transporter permease subunit [Aneurinibacillus sp. Ricciae_BoGa-3]WCK55588.1 efflux RND transporter permease subunit [Aneurinibacillus sp. Ricciae_BoGa-3]